MATTLDIIQSIRMTDAASGIRVYDAQGNPQSWSWVLAEFGPLDLRLAEPYEGQVVRLVEVREQFGDSALMVKLLHLDGSPVQGIEVAFYWPDAPELDTIPLPTSVWEPMAVHGPTNDNGDIGFGMGPGAYYYWPDQVQAGPHGSWVLAPGHPSDGLFGLGMIAGTDHRHLNLTFQVIAVDDGDDGDDGEDSDELAYLKRIAVAVEKIAAVFA